MTTPALRRESLTHGGGGVGSTWRTHGSKRLGDGVEGWLELR
ncbi:hypothetical protein FHR72_000183 [Mycolicibacterium iranicum]|uniref:Uncharacterized protein n=1 Tax=Mycolicibacterium iranicum TaxID=912594 RepID=A0A839Q3A0_MYCIR|nr:hypothetical protein [Mycolicibacterium iranicum]MBB2988726.1 hypothetical protein [Mycolicibacterium iranicum]